MAPQRTRDATAVVLLLMEHIQLSREHPSLMLHTIVDVRQAAFDELSVASTVRAACGDCGSLEEAGGSAMYACRMRGSVMGCAVGVRRASAWLWEAGAWTSTRRAGEDNV